MQPSHSASATGLPGHRRVGQTLASVVCSPVVVCFAPSLQPPLIPTGESQHEEDPGRGHAGHSHSAAREGSLGHSPTRATGVLLASRRISPSLGWLSLMQNKEADLPSDLEVTLTPCNTSFRGHCSAPEPHSRQWSSTMGIIMASPLSWPRIIACVDCMQATAVLGSGQSPAFPWTPAPRSPEAGPMW